MKKFSFTKIVLIFIVVLFIPLLSYTIYQYLESDKNEDLIRSIYENQLETILFSVNSNSWDVFNSWSTGLTTKVSAALENRTGNPVDSVLRQFVNKQQPVVGVVLELGNGKILQSWEKGDHLFYPKIWRVSQFKEYLGSSTRLIRRMERRAREGYVNPIPFRWNKEEDLRITLLIFPIIFRIGESSHSILAGLFIDDSIYIEEVVARKFSAINEDEKFVFAVRENDTRKIAYSTEEFPESEFEKSAALWILPDLSIEIRTSGTTLREISASRTRTNLFFLAVINLVLLAGIFYLLRNVFMQMKLARMQTDFVANVSHELRTPLAIIRMFAETLEMGRLSSEEKKRYYYESIMNESTRLTQLINNILDFSKIQTNKKTYQFVSTQLNDLVQNTLEMYNFHLKQKGIKLETNLSKDLGEIRIDPEAVKQAFLNLLENAVKFCPDKKKIVVDLFRKEQRIILSVTDFGIGIPDSEQKKIFEKFYRATNTTKYQTPGSGLGLALVRNIMEAHGGKIKVKSKIGEGSTFSLIFPLDRKTGGANV